MKKHLLVAPGPTQVPERARLVMAESMIHHRGPEFTEVIREVRQNLKWIYQTNQDVLILTCSGTGGFEAAIRTFTRQTDKVVAIGGGKFGERWGKVAAAYGMRVIDVDVEWGECVDLDELDDLLDAHPDAAMVTMCASETSTGVYHPVREVVELVRSKTGALVAIDGITAVGVHDIPMDDWGIDILVSGSQKAFSVPPGLAFVAASERAWERSKESDHHGFYLDLRRERARQADNQTAFTPAISVVLALREVLKMMSDEGLESIFSRHAMLSEGTLAAVRAMGLTPFATIPSHALTAVKLPDAVSAPRIVAALRDMGVTIAGGQAALKPHLIRIGHLGYIAPGDVLTAIAALEKALSLQGYDLPGSGLEAAQTVFEWSFN